jgi:hypothetical protein
MLGVRCPECGAPSSGVGRSRFHSTMSDAPLSYLKPLALSCWVMLGAWLASLGALAFVGASRGGPSSAAAWMLVFCTASVWAWGVWVMTAMRRPGVPEGIDHQREWRGLRLFVRASQIAWCVGALAFVGAAWAWKVSNAAALATAAAAANSPTAPIGQAIPVTVTPALARAMSTLGSFVWLVAFAGLPGMLVYMSRLAHWASDTALSDRLVMSAIAVGAGVPMMIVCFGVVPMLGVPVFSLVAFTLGALALIAVLLGVGQGVWALIQFANMARWVVRNADEQIASEIRRSDRIVRRIVDGQVKHSEPPRTKAVHPETELPRTTEVWQEAPAPAHRRYGAVTTDPGEGPVIPLDEEGPPNGPTDRPVRP